MMGLGKCILFFKYGIILGIYVKFRGGVSNIRKCKNAYSLGRDKTVMILVTTVPGKGMEGGHPNT